MIALILSLAAAAGDADSALSRRFSFEQPLPGRTVEQALSVEGCAVTVTHTVRDPETGLRRMVEISRFEVEHYAEVDGSPQETLDLSARQYFSSARDDGLRRWLDALGASREDRDRGARMRELQLRVDEGEFGAFAAGNGYEMRSFLEGDPEPYYAMPLPSVSIALPDDDPEGALAAWRSYAASCRAEPL